jgi:adenylate kinase family enzyme
MKRVLIIGSGGAGKSTLARRLGRETGIEVIHLDKLYWRPNWTEPSKDEWKRTVSAELAKDSWIIDGNFGGTMEMRLKACDAVVFLDLPRAVCLGRVLKRRISCGKNGRPDMAEGCNEKLDLKFLGWVWNFGRDTKPRIEFRLREFARDIPVFRLRSAREANAFRLHTDSNA